jgi:hypothetical protein
MIGKKFWCAVLVTMLAATTVLAQTALDGTIAGKVIDSQGLPVPGATVTVSSPALIQTAVVTTGQDGRYRAIRLPVGIYTVQVEMDGFNTVQREEIALAVGQSLEINVPLQLSAVAEVITVAGEQPVIDSQQVKNVQTITKEVVDQLPLARDARTAPTQLVPGVVERTSSGSQRNEEAFLVDGANMNDPDVGYGSARLSWDAIEEIEFITTSNPAENYGTIGGVMNIVTRSGSNDFRGMASYYFTNKNLSQILLPTEDSQTAGVGEPSQKEFERDISFRLSGPVMKDSLWFVANYRTFADEQLGSFVPVTIRGRQFENYNAIYDHTWVFAKLTAQFSPSVRWFGSYNYSNGDRPNEFSVPCCRTLEATRHWAAKQHAASSQLLWTLSDRTLIDARFGYMHFKYTGLAQDGTENNPHFFDEFSGYSWGRLNFGSDATDKKNTRKTTTSPRASPTSWTTGAARTSSRLAWSTRT